MATEQYAGPVDYVVFAFDERADPGAGLAALLERVDQGIVEVLDLEVIGRDDSGAPVKRSLSELQAVTGIDLATFEGVDSGILDESDRSAIAAELQSGQIALAVVYEDRSLASAAASWASAGGFELFSGGVDINELAHEIEEGKRS